MPGIRCVGGTWVRDKMHSALYIEKEDYTPPCQTCDTQETCGRDEMLSVLHVQVKARNPLLGARSERGTSGQDEKNRGLYV